MMADAIVWPEGEPWRAVVSRSRIETLWHRLGPWGMLASVRGKRMCTARPVSAEDERLPLTAANRCERARRRGLAA